MNFRLSVNQRYFSLVQFFVELFDRLEFVVKILDLVVQSSDVLNHKVVQLIYAVLKLFQSNILNY